VPAAYLKAETNHELHYILPFDEAKKGGFEKLFSALDCAPDDLHIASYGIADTSLEEVFLKITESANVTLGRAGKLSFHDISLNSSFLIVFILDLCSF